MFDEPIKQRWKNPNITWDKEKYKVEYLVVESDLVWHPKFAVRNRFHNYIFEL